MRPIIALPLLAASLSLLAIPPVDAREPASTFFQQAKVANFSIPVTDAASPGFESFAFWSDGSQSHVRYQWGNDGSELALTLLGPSSDGSRFGVSFPNGLVLDIAPTDKGLRVRDRKGRYDKTFGWQYEGPVDGRGTFCAQCVDEQDATAFVREHFLGR